MKIIPTIRRRALIIHYSGSGANHLNGVRIDIANINQFLCSDCGGAWEDDEITIAPNNCSAVWLENYFKNSGLVDYHLIFYSGHGSYDEEEGPIYWLNNEEVIYNAWLQEQIGDNAAMLISDSCQVIEELQKGGILESRSFSSTGLATDRVKCRRLYNDVLRKLPHGMFVTASSVSPGEEAAEDDIYGGYYIHSLLQSAKDIILNEEFQNGVYGIGYIHSLASEEVEQLSKGKQTPYLKGYTRSSQPPFIVKLRPERLM